MLCLVRAFPWDPARLGVSQRVNQVFVDPPAPCGPRMGPDSGLQAPEPLSFSLPGVCPSFLLRSSGS